MNNIIFLFETFNPNKRTTFFNIKIIQIIWHIVNML